MKIKCSNKTEREMKIWNVEMRGEERGEVRRGRLLLLGNGGGGKKKRVQN
jgi:hypothetical protein